MERLHNEIVILTGKQNVVVVLVNHAVNKYSGNFGSGRKNKIIGIKPAMGKYWSQIPDIRLRMQKSRSGEFSIWMDKSKRFSVIGNESCSFFMHCNAEKRRVALR